MKVPLGVSYVVIPVTASAIAFLLIVMSYALTEACTPAEVANGIAIEQAIATPICEVVEDTCDPNWLDLLCGVATGKGVRGKEIEKDGGGVIQRVRVPRAMLSSSIRARTVDKCKDGAAE